jgi:histidyl-tRNA synthetase
MIEKGISETAIQRQPLFNFTGTISEKLNQLSVLLSRSNEGMKGLKSCVLFVTMLQNLDYQPQF